jgi:hypothetical protein
MELPITSDQSSRVARVNRQTTSHRRPLPAPEARDCLTLNETEISHNATSGCPKLSYRADFQSMSESKAHPKTTSLTVRGRSGVPATTVHRRIFLAAFRECGVVSRAAEAAGIDRKQPIVGSKVIRPTRPSSLRPKMRRLRRSRQRSAPRVHRCG